MALIIGLEVKRRYDVAEQVENMRAYESLPKNRFIVLWVYDRVIYIRARDEADASYLIDDECNPVYGHGDGPYPPRVKLLTVWDMYYVKDVTAKFQPPEPREEEIKWMEAALREDASDAYCQVGVGGGEICFLPFGHFGGHDPDAVPRE